MLNISRYQKRPLTVDAVLVTEDNIADVATWVGGVAQSTFTNTTVTASHPTTYILQDRHIQIFGERGSMMAYIGDYVLKQDDGKVSVYTAANFDRDFEYLHGVEHPDQLELDLDL